MAEGQVGIYVQFRQAFDRQQALGAPGGFARFVRQRRGACDGAGLGAGDFSLSRLRGVVGLGRFRWQVAVDVERVGLENGAQRLLGKVLNGDAAAEAAVVELQIDVVERQTGRGRSNAADQLDLAQAAFAHRRQCLADAVDEFRQIELGNGNAAADLWRLVEIVGLQLTQGAQLVGGYLDAGPFGDVRCLVQQ